MLVTARKPVSLTNGSNDTTPTIASTWSVS